MPCCVLNRELAFKRQRHGLIYNFCNASNGGDKSEEDRQPWATPGFYQVNCQACHLPDGSGRIGSTLVADAWKHERATTDVGMFEILYGSAWGANSPSPAAA